MIVTKHKYFDEFWGAKIPIYEYEITESCSDEVFDFLVEEIEKGLDEIPSEIEVFADDGSLTLFGGDIIIDPYEYLTDEQVEKLEKMIEEEE